MEKRNNKINRLVLIITVCSLCILTAFLGYFIHDWNRGDNSSGIQSQIGGNYSGNQSQLGDPYWGLKENNIYNTNTGNVSIGTTSPSAKFQVNNGTVLFSGTTGNTPVSGTGTRLMWIPSKAAFWAGSVDWDYWNDSYIGLNSVAMGFNPVASGIGSASMGYKTNAIGDYSTAIGDFEVANGESSTAIGCETQADGNFSTAIGTWTHSIGIDSTAMGAGTTSYGAFSTSMGFQTMAIGDYSTAMGLKTMADGPNSTAMGLDMTVKGLDSLGIGLSYNNTNWEVNANHVMSIMGGKVGIGTTNPIALLDVNNSGEEICIGGDATNPGIELRDTDAHGGTPYIDFSNSAAVDFNMRMMLTGDHSLAIMGGNVGIGTTNPTRTLTIGDVMRIEPSSSFPTGVPGDGDLCVQGTPGHYHIYCYLNGNWRQLD